MRKSLILLVALLSSTPALAQPAAPESIQIPRELTDPATGERLAGTMQALSKALLDVRVGELKAAAEGREATSAEKRMTVRDMARRQDPNFERNLQRQIAQSGPMIRQGMKAMSDALPAMMQGLEQAQKALERAAANMPDPTYPRR
jgi:hypothetical protein